MTTRDSRELRSLTGIPLTGFRPAVWAPIVLCGLVCAITGALALRATLSNPPGTLPIGALLGWPVAAIALWLTLRSWRNRQQLAAQVLRRRGLTALRRGRYAAARECFDDALAIEPDAWQARYDLGLLATREERLRDARDHFAAGLAAAPNEAGLRWALASTQERLGAFEEARNLLDELLDSYPAHADARCLRGSLHERDGEVQRARDAYEAVIARQPHHHAARENLARLDAPRLPAFAGSGSEARG